MHVKHLNDEIKKKTAALGEKESAVSPRQRTGSHLTHCDDQNQPY